MAKEHEPCLGAERGVHWPKVRRRLVAHLLPPAAGSPNVSQDGPGGPARRARAAVEEVLPEGLLANLETSAVPDGDSQGEFKCLAGWVAILLLVCATPGSAEAAEGPCLAEVLQWPVRFALGLHSWNTWRALRDGWPLPAVLLAALARMRGPGVLELAAPFRDAQPQQTASSNSQTSAALLEVLCPYTPPFDEVLCVGRDGGEQDGAAHSEALAASASVHLAAASERLRRSVERADAAEGPVAESCHGLEPLCRRAAVDRDVRELLSQAQGMVRRVLSHTPPDEALDLLARGRWRLVEPLVQMQVTLESRDLSPMRTAGAVPPEQARVAWRCSLHRWTTREAGTVAAAVRLLREVLKAGSDPERLWAAVVGRSAEASCGALRPRQTAETLLSAGAGDALDSMYYRVQSAGHSIQDHPDLPGLLPDELDEGECLPGMFAVAAACSAIAVGRNDLAGFHVMQDLALMNGGLLMRSEPEEVDRWWEILVPFLLDSSELLKGIWDILIRSTRWWLGGQAAEGPDFRQGPDDEPAAGPCFGVLKAGEGHSCRQQPGAEVASPRAADLAARGMPALKILGVGLLKAGSTAVIQALRAALLWPTGFDCSPRRLSAAVLVRRVRRREDPLLSLLEACGREVFAFQLGKDQTFTPLAPRLLSMWPGISADGSPLRLYFVVRDPFSFLISLAARLDWSLGRGLPADQQMTVINVPTSFPRDFQIYLDTEADGLNYTGIVDAMVQRWALEVDVYLRCPRIFALVRYEDFKHDPVLSTRQLLQQLGHGHVWNREAAQRVAQAADTRYQGWAKKKTRETWAETLGGPLMHRIWRAVGARARRLSYGELEGEVAAADPGDPGLWPAPVHVPPLPELQCEA